jgi:hypothetical protein
MDTIFVYLDDAAFARQQLAPMRGGQPTHWVLIACAPRLTRRIGKWVSNSARTQWRAKWADKLFTEVAPQLRDGDDRVTTVVAKGPLPQLTRELFARHGVGRVLDARRPKFGQALPPVTADQPAGERAGWEVPGAVAGLGAALLLAAE